MAKRPKSNRSKAIAEIAAAAADLSPSPGASAMYEDALRHDLDNAPQADIENRVTKIESQIDVLSDAVIVLAQPSGDVKRAVRAVRNRT